MSLAARPQDQLLVALPGALIAELRSLAATRGDLDAAISLCLALQMANESDMPEEELPAFLDRLFQARHSTRRRQLVAIRLPRWQAEAVADQAITHEASPSEVIEAMVGGPSSRLHGLKPKTRGQRGPSAA